MKTNRPSPARALLLALLGGAAGCSSGTWTPYDGELRCDPRELLEGEVRIKQIGCSDERLSGGEGTTGDWLLENALARFALRYGTGLTRFETSGGTVVDASLPSRRDGLREATPLFETPAGLEPLSAAVATALEERDSDDVVVAVALEVEGTTPSGASGRFRWTLSADDPSLRIEGADAVELLPLAPAEWVGAVAEVDPDDDVTIEVLVGMDGEVTGQGAARTFVGPTLLTAGNRVTIREALWPDGQAMSGVSDATWIEARDDEGALLARLPVEGDTVQGLVPAAVTSLQPVRAGFRNGDEVEPGVELDLPIGPEGRLDLTVTDANGAPLPATVLWAGSAYPTDAGGGTVALPPGSGPLTVYAGPAYEAVTLDPVRILDRPALSVALERVQPDDALVAHIGLLAAPDRGSLRSSRSVVEEAVAAGASVVVVAARDEVAERAEPTQLARETVVWAGTAANDPAGGALAWPYSASVRQSAHGAAPWPILSATELLSWMSRSGRWVAVSTSWLDRAGPPWTWPVVPWFVQLHDLDDLDAWFAALDQGAALEPVGPVTWLHGFDAANLNSTEVQRALFEGPLAAGNGPRVTLTPRAIQDAGGSVARYDVACSGPSWMPLTHVDLMGPSGVLATFPATSPSAPQVQAIWTEADPPSWAVAVCYGSNSPLPPGEPLWAASSAAWLRAP